MAIRPQFISYQTAIGQALLGHKVGEIVELNDDKESKRLVILSIEAAPRDVTPPDPTLAEVGEATAV